MARTERNKLQEISRDFRAESRPGGARMTSVVASEEIITAKAPAALATLRQMGAIDLADMLGLAPHLEGPN